jgi:hypothetical protein
MKAATLTSHAKKRISERCGLSEKELRQLLDAGAGIAIHLQKGGRYAHRLIYSYKDDDWFMVVQDGGDGGVLTVMPLNFLEGRTEVTAAQKRQARSRANAVRKAAEAKPVIATPEPSEPKAPPPPPPATPPAPQQEPLPGWKIRVRYSEGSKTHFKSLPRTLAEHLGPAHWRNVGPVHHWLKERLVEAKIPVNAIECILAEWKGHSEQVDELLEHLPLTPEEIESCH